jgi:mRNA interferase MazF
MHKDFENWNKVKVASQLRQGAPTFREREIWWCRLGVNIGDEEDGKGVDFNRPVLILRKFNKRIFWGVPLTTQIKEKFHYHKIYFKDKPQCIMLTQLRLWDNRRLMNNMGMLDKEQFTGIKEKIKDLV